MINIELYLLSLTFNLQMADSISCCVQVVALILVFLIAQFQQLGMFGVSILTPKPSVVVLLR